MNLKEVTACVLVKNEEYFIRHVLSPLIKTMGEVLVFDTGSTDRTVEFARSIGATVVEKGQSDEYQVGGYRNEMNRMAKNPWTMIVDGDELYSVETLLEIEKYDIPEGKQLGFTRMCSVDWKEPHGYVLIADMFNRVAFHPRTATYKGVYPFESPHLFDEPNKFFYVPTEGFAFHLHRLNRSPKDDEVYLRKDKQFKYSMQDAQLPIVGPVVLPLDPNYPNPYELP